MSTLELRYRRLLRVYPSAYRAEREGEILDTLLEMAPDGQVTPTWRERRALVMGALRVRAAQNRRLPTRTNWRLAAMFGFALFLSALCAPAALSNTGFHSVVSRSVDWFGLLTNLAIVVVAVLPAFAPARVVIGCALVAGVASAVHAFVAAEYPRGIPMTSVLLIVFAVLARGGERMPRLWLWPFAVFTLVLVLSTLSSTEGLGWAWVMIALAVGVILWMIVDARPALAFAVMLSASLAYGAVAALELGSRDLLEPGFPVILCIVAVLGVPAAWRLRGQAVL